MEGLFKAFCFVFISTLVSGEECKVSTELSATSPSGVIGSDSASFEANQTCIWRLPSQSFPDDSYLFLYIHPYDFYDEKGVCHADIALGDKMLACKSIDYQCVLYKKKLDLVNFDHIQQEMGFRNNPCSRWDVEEKMLRTISIRILAAVSNLPGKVEYRYITKRISRATQTPIVTTTTTISTPFKELPEDRREECSSCVGFIVAFAVVLVLLALACLALFYYLRKKPTSDIKRQPRTRGSFFQTLSVDDEVDGTSFSHSVSPTVTGRTYYPDTGIATRSQTAMNLGIETSTKEPTNNHRTRSDPEYDVPRPAPRQSVDNTK